MDKYDYIIYSNDSMKYVVNDNAIDNVVKNYLSIFTYICGRGAVINSIEIKDKQYCNDNYNQYTVNVLFKKYDTNMKIVDSNCMCEVIIEEHFHMNMPWE